MNEPSTEPGMGIDPSLAPDPHRSLGLESQRMRAAIETRVFGAATFPARVGRFTVLDRLGEGGMGTVWAAYDPQLDRRVAIKVLHRRPGQIHAFARMRREALALARLDHPNVVAVHEVGAIDDHLYIAMEFAKGTLATWCAANPPGPGTHFAAVLALAIQAARGLAAAHAAGLVHRDLKPSNLLVDDDGRVRLADFGLARVAADTSTIDADDAGVDLAHHDDALTAPGEILGTPAYMAPEQIEGRADARTDQFGLCATLWEAALGVRPFAGTTLVERAQAIAVGRPRLPANAGQTPAWFRDVLRRGLANAPAGRWPDIAALLHALERGRDRGRRRRIVAVAIVAASGLALALGLRSTEIARRCGDAEARLAPAWTMARRDALPPDLAREIDGFAAAWTKRYESTCRTLAADGMIARDAPLPVASSPRLACLTEARDALLAIVDALATTTSEAVDVANALPELGDCDDHDIVAAGDASRATDPALARARALAALGRLDAADAAVDAIAAATAAGPLEEVRARIESQRGNHAGATEHATRALAAAEQTRDRELAVRAWLHLAAAAAARGHDEHAGLCAERAESLARRITPTSLRAAATRALATTVGE